MCNACRLVGSVLKENDTVVFESTVFPGATEEELIPLIEKQSKLIFNKDFYCGYSPERINPGDKINTITKIKKVTSGSTNETLENDNDLIRKDNRATYSNTTIPNSVKNTNCVSNKEEFSTLQESYVPYATAPSNQPVVTNNEELMERINYMIFLLEEQKNEKTGSVHEEMVLYSFLGVFVIFIVDSFARAGKYCR